MILNLEQNNEANYGEKITEPGTYMVRINRCINSSINAKEDEYVYAFDVIDKKTFEDTNINGLISIQFKNFKTGNINWGMILTLLNVADNVEDDGKFNPAKINTDELAQWIIGKPLLIEAEEKINRDGEKKLYINPLYSNRDFKLFKEYGRGEKKNAELDKLKIGIAKIYNNYELLSKNSKYGKGLTKMGIEVKSNEMDLPWDDDISPQKEVKETPKKSDDDDFSDIF